MKNTNNNSNGNFQADGYQPMFWNSALDKGRLKSFVSWFLKNHGERKTLEFLEQLKILGFGYATKAGISLGIEDLKIPPIKAKLLADAESVVAQSHLSYRKGEITGIEKMQLFIETWNETSETLKQEVVRYFEKTDVLNPVYMMAFSGARGNLSQVRQLVGMRGLMSDPQGKIIDFPIQSNFREGLTLTEYLISTYGARKGIVDTALRTATAGYLTRRLVDVAQHVIVSKFDCGTQRGIFLFDMKEGIKTIYSFQNRLTGRVLAQDIEQTLEKNQILKIAFRNQEISSQLAEAISKVTKKALVRSPLTCETKKLVCQLCYGWSLGTSRLVSMGETVGVIAGQSIGEPGTQLTMRTFHTGGVFSANITQQINAPFTGIVEYAHPIAGTCVRTPLGNLAFLTKTSGTLFLKKYNLDGLFPNFSQVEKTKQKPISTNTYKIPAFTILFARHGEFMTKDSILAQISAVPTGQNLTQTIEQTIYSSLEGEVYYNQIDLLEEIDDKYGERISKAEDWSNVWVLSAKISQNSFLSSFFPEPRDFISKSSIVNQIEWILPNSQKSVFDFQNAQSLKEDFREYASIPKNQAFSRIPNFQKIETLKKETLDNKQPFAQNFRTVHSVKIKDSKVEIRSKYNIKQKFLEKTNFNMYSSSTNLVKTSKSKPFEFMKNFTSTGLDQNFFVQKSMIPLNTEFLYPYHPSFRARFSKVLKQTFVSLPMLRPGILETWLSSTDSSSLNKQFKNNVFLDSKNQEVFVKKLNTNLKFRIYNAAKVNFLHPLILANSVPFTLKVKTIQRWLHQSDKSQKAFQVSLVNLNFKKNHTNGVSKTKGESPKNHETQMKIKFQTSQKKDLKFEKHHFKKTQLQKQDKFNFPKFENLSIKTPLLRLKTQNLQYQKFGYFMTIPLNSGQPDQFFSLLPLQKNSFGVSNQDKLIQENAKQTSFDTFNKNLQISQKFNPIQLTNLKNSYQWAPKPNNSFYWLPKTFENGQQVFSVSNPIHSQELFNQKFSDLKNLKNTVAHAKKYLEKFNLAQSQYCKKAFVKSIQENAFNKFIFKFSRKSKNKIQFTQLKPNSKEKNVTFKKFVWGKKFKFSTILLNENNILQKPENFKYKNFSKVLFNANTNETKEELQKFNEFKNHFFGKKEDFEVQAQNSLTFKFNMNKKASVPIQEIFSLAQENYTVKTTTHLKNSKVNSLFVSKKKNQTLKSENFEVYLTNLQGNKKPFCFQNEGYLKVQYFRNSKLNFSSKSVGKFKKYPSIFRQNFVFKLKNLKTVSFQDKTKENVLKSQFLNYLKSNKFLKKQKSTHHNNFENATFSHSKKILHVHGKNWNQLFTFIPFIRSTQNLSLWNGTKPWGIQENLPERLNTLTSSQFTKIVNKPKTSFVNFTLKPGWIYKTKNIFQMLYCHKTMLEKGQTIVDDISFENHKVFLEVIRFPNKTKFSSLLVSKEGINLENQNFKKFVPSRFIENPNVRFLKNKNKEKKQENQNSSKNSEENSSFFILIRPFSHKILPNPLQMKTQLYKSMTETKFKEFETSYFSYKQYFSGEMNSQSNKFKTLSNFPPMDFTLESVDSFSLFPKENTVQVKSLTNISQTMSLKTFSKNKRKQLLVKKRGKKKTFQRKKRVCWYFCSKFLTKSFSKKPVSIQRKFQIYKKTLGNTKSSKAVTFDFLKNQHFYFSNYPLNIGCYRLYFNASSSNPLDLSIGKLSVKFQSFENNLFKKLAKTNIEKKLKNNYLNILMNRKTIETQTHKQKNESLKNHLIYTSEKVNLNKAGCLKNHNKTKVKSVFLNGTTFQSFLKFVENTPFFEYSVHRQYNFFANQRLFASTFYKQQFNKSLKFNVLNDSTFLQENIRNKKFIQNYLKKNAFADSLYHSPVSKNQVVFKKESFENSQTFGFTNFYSSYEGEVLKDYAKEQDVETLQKGFNVNLDTGHLIERQGQQLILTKSDLFSVSLNKFKQSTRNSFKIKVKKQSYCTFSDRNSKNAFFESEKTKAYFEKMYKKHQQFQNLETKYFNELDLKQYEISDFTTNYQNKNYKLKTLNFGLPQQFKKLRLGNLMRSGHKVYSTAIVLKPGQIIHMNSNKLTLRKAEFFSISPRAILHTYNGHCVRKNVPVMTLPYETLKTGDIVQGIPKVEQYLEARTTIQGRLFLNSLPVLLYAIYQRYSSKLNMQKAVRQSLLKIQQILVDGIQRVYRSQGVSIADKHLEIIVRQMTSKVKIIHGGQTGFFAGELVDLEFVERINTFLMIKVRYEPVVLGITRASLEVDSFLSASSFQQTTKVLTRAAMENKKDFLKGLKENLLVGNLLPAGTGYMIPIVN